MGCLLEMLLSKQQGEVEFNPIKVTKQLWLLGLFLLIMWHSWDLNLQTSCRTLRATTVLDGTERSADVTWLYWTVNDWKKTILFFCFSPQGLTCCALCETFLLTMVAEWLFELLQTTVAHSAWTSLSLCSTDLLHQQSVGDTMILWRSMSWNTPKMGCQSITVHHTHAFTHRTIYQSQSIYC